jgi:iron complex outermembrane recepter protein
MNSLNSIEPLNRDRNVLRLRRRRTATALFSLVFLTLALTDANAQADRSAIVSTAGNATGALIGTVANSATGNLLAGARVEIPALRLETLTNSSGRYSLSGVPAGQHEIHVHYTGLDTIQQSVAVGAGQRVQQNFDLTSSIYQLTEFVVSGEREGNALAITAQRNAENVKNVVALDAYGNLPNMSAGELAIRLPGVAGQLDDEGNVTGIIVRGQPSTMNRVTVDGGLIANAGGMNRQFQTQNFTAALFEQLELIKGHTPDKGADSLGGTINLKTRSPLSLKEKRRVVYNLTGRWAPPFTQQIPLREDHRLHPLFNLAYQEVFDVMGGERNLGIAVNTFYSENANGYFQTVRDYQNTTDQPAYLWDYRTTDGYNNRQQINLSLKADYRLSPTTKFSFNTIYNDGRERRNPIYTMRAFTGNSNTVPSATSGVIPGFTSRITEVRPVAASTIDVSETIWSALNRTRAADFGGEHDLDSLFIDYNLAYSQMHLNLGNSNAGNMTTRLTGVGWILDRTESDLYPRLIQTAGPDWSDPANYRPTGFLVSRNNHRDVEVRDVRANVRYRLPTRAPLFLKTGFQWREQMALEISPQRRWEHIGASSLPADPSIRTWAAQKTGLTIPHWETASMIRHNVPVDASQWQEDMYFAEQQKYTGSRAVTETVTAGYIMAQAKFGRVGLLSGVRIEKTEDDSWGWVRAHSGSTTAEQQADPVGAAERDYANTRRDIHGSYTKSFPSTHLTYDFTPNLKARLAWSTSFGRPSMANLVPNESYNDTNQTLTINNPSLLPQTSENWDATLDYYFEPVGNFSIGWFHKTIEDYIVSGVESGTVGSGPDNGFGGDYAGYGIRTSTNAGTATVQGWELGYQQQLTFLPGLLKGLGIAANYTRINTHGDFGSTTSLSTGQVAGFIPETANASLTWRHRKFNTYLRWNYTSEYISSYTAASIGRNQYRHDRRVLDVGVAYQLKPWLSLICDVNNITNEPTAFYRGIPDQMERTTIHGTTITAGITGRF